MPSAFITKTVWVASNSATPHQMAAIQNHRGDSERVTATGMFRIVLHHAARLGNNAANRRSAAAGAMEQSRVAARYFPHDQQNQGSTTCYYPAGVRSRFQPVLIAIELEAIKLKSIRSESVEVRSGIHQRRSAEIPRK